MKSAHRSAMKSSRFSANFLEIIRLVLL